MRKVKRVLAVALTLALILGLCACSGNNNGGSTNSDNGSTDDGGSSTSSNAGRTDVVYGLTSDVGSLDHIASTDQISNILWRQLYDTLVEKDEDGNWVGKLAESWEISDDGCTYTFYLRQDVVCHDGQPMTAEDVAYSINREIESSANGPCMVNMIDCTVVDEFTVNINLSAPYEPTLEVLLAWGRISSARTTDYDTNPIGTGPYKLVSRSSGDNIVLEAWDQYYLGEATIKNLTFRILTDPTTQVAALQADEIDFLTHCDLSAKETVESDSNLVWQETIFRGNVWVTMREDLAPFDNVLARKAVQYAIDKDAMLMGGSEGMGQILKTMWPANVTASPEADYEPSYSYDVEKAKDYLNQYMEETGVSEVNIEILAPDTAMYLNPAVTMEGMLREAGFTVTTKQIERATFWSSLQSGNYQIAVAGTSWAVQDGDAEYMYLHSSQAGGQNYIPCMNDEIDEQLDLARSISDEEERRAAYTRVQEVLDEEAILVTLYQPANAVAYSKDLKGVDTENDLYQHYVYDWSW